MNQAEERIKDYMDNLDQNYAEYMDEESGKLSEPKAKSSVDCRVINFLAVIGNLLCKGGFHKMEDMGEVYSRVSVNGQRPHLYKCKRCGVEEKAIYVSQKHL